MFNEDGIDCTPEEHPGPIVIRIKKEIRDMVLGLYRPDNQSKIWLLVSAAPILDSNGNVLNVIVSFTDITEQKRLSQQLIEQEIHRQRLLTQATIDGQEKERQEIGKELHDNINQHLTTTRLYLQVAREKASGEVLEMIKLAHKNLADIVNEIRNLSQSLVPPTLGDLGLIESIAELCDALKRAHSFQVEFHYRHFSEEALPGNLKLMIFRIIQEQVSNIIRHAHASHMQIRLQSDAEFVICSISDNGKGFDPGHYKKGMGLSNIANRADLFDGKVEIHSAPGKGCTITVTIPIPHSDELMHSKD
jgi:signal transduction histidine kinase